MLEEETGQVKVYSQTRLAELEPALVHTVGYEGRDVDGFVKSLQKAGVTRLIDVRDMPVSRKKGFSKSALAENLEKAGIEYRHIQSLGAPPHLRKEVLLKEGYNTFFKLYLSHMKSKPEALDLLEEYSRTKPSAIMCFEKNPSTCHRHVLANELHKRGFEVRNI
jgi:uncharacterized protein (DUF488 family)